MCVNSINTIEYWRELPLITFNCCIFKKSDVLCKRSKTVFSIKLTVFCFSEHFQFANELPKIVSRVPIWTIPNNPRTTI